MVFHEQIVKGNIHLPEELERNNSNKKYIQNLVSQFDTRFLKGIPEPFYYIKRNLYKVAKEVLVKDNGETFKCKWVKYDTKVDEMFGFLVFDADQHLILCVNTYAKDDINGLYTALKEIKFETESLINIVTKYIYKDSPILNLSTTTLYFLELYAKLGDDEKQEYYIVHCIRRIL